MERMERPKPTILPDSSLVPEESLVQPAPTRFTHELTANQMFHFTASDQNSPPNGELSAGSRVVLVRRDGDVCEVVDSRGLRVLTSCKGLHPLI
jgi:hypothetical protein